MSPLFPGAPSPTSTSPGRRPPRRSVAALPSALSRCHPQRLVAGLLGARRRSLHRSESGSEPTTHFHPTPAPSTPLLQHLLQALRQLHHLKLPPSSPRPPLPDLRSTLPLSPDPPATPPPHEPFDPLLSHTHSYPPPQPIPSAPPPQPSPFTRFAYRPTTSSARLSPLHDRPFTTARPASAHNSPPPPHLCPSPGPPPPSQPKLHPLPLRPSLPPSPAPRPPHLTAIITGQPSPPPSTSYMAPPPLRPPHPSSPGNRFRLRRLYLVQPRVRRLQPSTSPRPTCIRPLRLLTEVGSAILCSAKWVSGVVVLYGQDKLGVVAAASVLLTKILHWVAELNFYVALANIVILRLRLHMASLELLLDSLMAAFKSLHSHDSYFIGLIGFVVLWFHWFFQCLSTILPPPGCHLDFFKSTGGILFLVVTHASSAYLSGAEVGHHLQAMVSWISIIVWINYLGFSDAILTSAWSSCSATASHMLGAFEAVHVGFQNLVDIFTSRILDLLSRKAGIEAPLLSHLSLPSSWCLHYISCTRKIIWTFSDVILSFLHYLVDVITLSY